MELRQLRYFVEAFDRGSLSAAAKSLVISQPALTRQLQLLERECGVALFERVPTGLLPTRSGTALYQHVIMMLRYADSARDAAREAGPVRETVEIGLAPGLALPWLYKWIDAVHLRHPEVYLSLSDSSSNTHLHRVRAGHLDIAFLHEPPPQDMYQELVLEDDFGVVIEDSQNTVMGADETFELRHLDDLDVLVHSREQVPIGHDELIAATHQVGANPRWHFANYTENAHACMRATGATTAIMARVSAERLLPGWKWKRLVNPSLVMHTWLVRRNVARRAVIDVSAVISEALHSPVEH